jgi:5-methyltetrahydrofolate--homocysteine methyltransferase
MSRKYTNRRYLDLLKEHVAVFDGAMGTNLQVQNLTAEHFGGERFNGCNDFLVISYPQAVEKVHRSFLEAGVDVIETCTFRANRLTLKEYTLENRVDEINRAAASIARKLADEFSSTGQPRFVAGSIGPTGKLPSMNDPELSNITFDELVDIFREQAASLIQGGVDLLIIETSQDILEVKAAILGIQKAFEETAVWLPIQAQVTLDTTGRMLLGTDISAVDAILEGFPIDVIGLNCSTGPDFMREPIRQLAEQTNLPVSCIPNAGLPLNVDGQAVYPMLPQPFTDTLSEFVTKFGINVVGGCCGTTPEHMKVLVDTLKNQKPVERSSTPIPRLASAVQISPMIQEPAPFLIGERLNSQGSKKFKQLLMDEDYDSMITIARDQIENGAHGLDLCVALTERSDEAALMRNVLKVLSPVVKVPFIFDSTEPEVLETALKNAPGRSLINSTNLESGRAKADIIFNLAKKYNAAVIVLTIDEIGMAKTAERKLEIAKRIYQIATEDHGLQAGDLVFDDLTFTLATGDPEFSQSAIETLEGIRKIKAELPGVLTSLGVSNISFGLKQAARAVINSTMLFHAVQAGLDMAIVNPSQIKPYSDIPVDEREMTDDLIFNRRPDALQRLIEHFETSVDVSLTNQNQVSPLEGMTASQRIHWKILHRIKDGIETDLDELLQQDASKSKSENAVHILNSVLLPAMKEVGDKFGSGELILPFVLQSAEVMKKSVTYLEQFLERLEGTGKGTLVLATVYGDVHDIGKNLVKTILSNNGYTVHDLGKQVPAETIISKAVELKADAIGLSALLVSTSKQMPLIVNELHRRGLNFPVLIGGAAINRRFGRRILMTDQNEFFEPGVFYCKDAFEGLSTMDSLVDETTKPAMLEQLRQEANFELGQVKETGEQKSIPEKASSVMPAPKIPVVREYGPKLVKQMPLESVFQCLSKNELFRLSWGAKNTHGDEWVKLQADYEERLLNMIKQAAREKWLKPQGMYGLWPCQSIGDDLILYDSDSIKGSKPVEMNRFHFPRQQSGENLCLADYFASIESGKMDVVAFQIVTVGLEATERFDRLQKVGDYSEGYFTHGLAVQMAEASAEYLHSHIRRELGIEPNQGKRYSWGYPAIPELADHAKVFSLLPVEKELGMSLTTAFQLVPEQSTAAIILHHPQAKYYNIGESRIEQLMKE